MASAALKPYRAVLNGTHNEYTSERMMDATEDYLADGGRLLYLGGKRLLLVRRLPR